MKKQLIFCTVLCLMLNIPAFSNSERGYINSNAIVEKELSPDTVELSVAVVTYDAKSLQTASAENKMLSDKIYNALNEMIDNNNGDYVKTSNYNAQPIYVYVNGKRNFEKYQVSNRVVVHTKNIKQTGNFIDKAIQLGATNVDSIRFSLSSYENYCDEMLIEATVKSKNKALALAKASGAELAGVKSLNVSCNTTGNNSRIMYNSLAKTEAMDSAITTPITSGIIKLHADVNASYFVK